MPAAKSISRPAGKRQAEPLLAAVAGDEEPLRRRSDGRIVGEQALAIEGADADAVALEQGDLLLAARGDGDRLRDPVELEVAQLLLQRLHRH